MRIKITCLLIVFFWFNFPCFAQAQPSKEMSVIERTAALEREEKALRKKIEEKKKKLEVEKKPSFLPLPIESQEKIFIKDIRVTKATQIPQKEINAIIASYVNKELVFSQIQEIVNKITDSYRQKGFITSRAYVPPQKIEKGILEITVLESWMGSIEVKGNRYFKTPLLKNKITLKKGQPFNYNTLRKNLIKINEHPDRFARAVLMPGKEAGQTDAILEVKDRLPMHLEFNWNNYGSRYIERDRYAARFTCNNLLGRDDKLTLQYQLAQNSRYFLRGLRYLLPLFSDSELGLYAIKSRVKLGQEYQDSDVRGKSSLYGIFVNKPLINQENLNLTFNLGFDYKDITNYQFQTVSSVDRLRVAKIGLDLDLFDDFNRTLITHEFDFGIPNIMGGLESCDSKASRSGSGGKFIKQTLNLLRLQKMPLSSSLLWKSQIQLSPYILTAIEQFQLGGISNIRGYPPAEATGDTGYTSTLEWLFPAYLISKEWKFPFSRTKVYDAFRVAVFYDWGFARLRRPVGNEEKNKTLKSAGWGMRFNLTENFSLRLDFAWPLDNTPSDGDHLHTWTQASISF
ncbi:MAG: POTRA domain-containing protein [Candidatus Omnitrophota bacterium]|nr:POTRA domain-containing protein [Candidatus Omnitrophota bacterium]